MIKSTTLLLKTVILLLLPLVICNCGAIKNSTSTDGTPWQKYYAAQLTPNARFIAATPTSTVEFTDGLFLVKEYYVDTKTVTSIRYYEDAQLTTQTGPEVKFNDLGKKIFKGNYVNNQLSGPAVTYDLIKGWKETEGAYVQGQKEGKFTEFDSAGTVVRIANFHKGELDGEEISYNDDGTVKYKSMWKEGKKISRNGGPAPDSSEEHMPAFPCTPKYEEAENCGEISLQHYLAETIHYPEDARDYGIMGTATISFVVGKDGKIQNVAVINGVCGSIKNECYRIMAAMPAWKPGFAEGHPVRVRFTLPVRFRLQ